MLSGYFKLITNTETFKNHMENIFCELEGKKVIIYGTGAGFCALNKEFNFVKKLNIVALSDLKFNKQQMYGDFCAIPPNEIKNADYDAILVTQEMYKPVVHYLRNNLCIEDKQILTVFEEEIPDEARNFNMLYEYKFKENLEKLVKKLKNKKVVIYGAGALFRLIHKYFDLSGLNVAAISDMKFDGHENDEEFLGYKVCAPVEIEDFKPDYVLICALKYLDIAEDLYCYTLKGTGIKIRQIVKKPFKKMLCEIWNG